MHTDPGSPSLGLEQALPAIAHLWKACKSLIRAQAHGASKTPTQPEQNDYKTVSSCGLHMQPSEAPPTRLAGPATSLSPGLSAGVGSALVLPPAQAMDSSHTAYGPQTKQGGLRVKQPHTLLRSCANFVFDTHTHPCNSQNTRRRHHRPYLQSSSNPSLNRNH